VKTLKFDKFRDDVARRGGVTFAAADVLLDGLRESLHALPKGSRLRWRGLRGRAGPAESVVLQSAETAAQWDAVFTGRAYAGSDVRHTSSSRHPGVDIVGTVRRRGPVRSPLAPCGACGLWWHDDGTPHARRIDGRDCLGRRT
jgi:hypothetical protein